MSQNQGRTLLRSVVVGLESRGLVLFAAELETKPALLTRVLVYKANRPLEVEPLDLF